MELGTAKADLCRPTPGKHFQGLVSVTWVVGCWINADANNPTKHQLIHHWKQHLHHQIWEIGFTFFNKTGYSFRSPGVSCIAELLFQNDRTTWKHRVLNHTSSESCAPPAYLSSVESDLFLKNSTKNNPKAHWKKETIIFSLAFSHGFRTASLGIFRIQWREVDFQTRLGSSDQTSTAISWQQQQLEETEDKWWNW